MKKYTTQVSSALSKNVNNFDSNLAGINLDAAVASSRRDNFKTGATAYQQ